MITAYGDAETQAQGAGERRRSASDQADRFRRPARRDRDAGRAGRVTATHPCRRRRARSRSARHRRNSAGRSATARSSFLFARDGVEALAIARREPRRRHGGQRHQHAAHGRPVAAAEAAGSGGAALDHHRLRLWRHGQYPHRDEPRRLRFPDQADRFRRPRGHDRQDHPACRGACARRAGARRPPSARMPRCRAISRRTSPSGSPATANGVELGGQRREVASLFTDIAGFTALAETLEPSMLGALLNEYLGGMTDIVFAHDGTVAKIVGDALHVLFGAPGEQPDHAARAVACALALDAFAQAFRDALARQGHRARRHAHRRACRAGDRRQFRRRPLLRLHGLWRHHQHRGAARGREQAARHAHLRKRSRGIARATTSSRDRSAA